MDLNCEQKNINIKPINQYHAYKFMYNISFTK